MLLPNSVNNTLEYWKVPESASPRHDGPIGILGLPRLRDDQFLGTISTRCEPNPTPSGTPYSNQPYNASSPNAIAIFNIRIQPLDMTPSIAFSLFIHRKSLLNICPEASLASSAPSQDDLDTTPTEIELGIIPWAEWGPPISRWLNAEVMPTRWITTTAGERCVAAVEQHDSQECTISILDFNPTRIRRMEAQWSHDSKVYMSVIKNPTSLLSRCFEEPVLSMLPYSVCITPQTYDYDGVLMDEERLIGLRVRFVQCFSRCMLICFSDR